MKTPSLRFSLVARLNLMNVLNQIAIGKPQDDDWQLSRRIYEKIQVPDPERENYQIVTRMGIFPNERAIRKAPALDVMLTATERERLRKILDHTPLRPMDGPWYDEISKQLK